MEFIDFLSESALSDLQKANLELVEMVANVDKVGQKMKGISTPSGSDSAVKGLTEQYKQQERVIASLQKQIEKLSAVKKQSNQKTAAEIANQQQLNRNALESAKINSKLYGAYQRLSLEQSKAARSLQDLIVRGRQATQTQKEFDKELRTSQNEFNKLNTKILSADRAVGKFNRNVGNYPTRAVTGIKDLIGAFGILGGAGLVAAIATDIFQTTKELQSLDLALKQVTETNELFAQSQAFLSGISEKYGIEINGLTRQFTQFYVSAKDKISGKEIQGIFESVAKSAGFMGLSVEAQDRAFTALNQMMSKGTVSAEELKGQLGEALPGAFGIMAKAMGTTEQGLAKLMKDGKVLAAEVLPKFAKELEKAYGIENKDRVESLAAAQTRLTNSWTLFVRTITEGDSAISKFFINMIGYLNNALKVLNKLMMSNKELYKNSTQVAYTDELKRQNDEYSKMSETQKKITAETRNFYAKQGVVQIKEEIQALSDRNKELLKDVRVTPLGRIYSKANEEERKRNLKSMEKLSYILYQNKARLDASNNVLNKNSELLNLNTKEVDKNTKKQKEKKQIKEEMLSIDLKAQDSTFSLINMLEQEKRKLEELQRIMSTNNMEWQHYQKAIDMVQQSIDSIVKGQTDLVESGKKVSDELTERGKKLEAEREALEKLQSATDEYIKSITSDFFAKAGLDSLNFFTRIQENGLTAFQELMKGADSVAEKFAITFNGIAEVAQEAFAFINQASEAGFQKEFERLDAQKEISLKYAGDSSAARENIEREYEERRRSIERKRAEQQKKAAIFNIGIDTAQAVIATLAQTPPPAGIPLALLVGAIGAAQLAMVASQQIPAYAEGTDNHKGGLMLINDGKGSNYTETVQTPDGKTKQYKGRNVLVNAPKGTKVFTHDQFNSQLDSILLNNGVNSPNIQLQNNGVTPSQMDSIIGKYFGKIQTNQTVLDKNGFSTFVVKGSQKSKDLNSVVTFKGFSV